MANPIKKGVYFVDGYSPRKNAIGLVSYLYENADKDVEHTRVYTIIEEEWGHWEVKDEIRSITYTEDPTWWLLGKRGRITKISPNGFETESIPDTGVGKGKYGNLTKIAKIGGELYACGHRRQVYKRVNGQWQHIDNGILEKSAGRPHGFLSMDGTGPKDIYAVGHKGQIFHYNGRRWIKCESPTNAKLESVRCVYPDLVFICGANGIILRGSLTAWDVINDESTTETFWDIEVFEGGTYISHMNGLFFLDDDTLNNVVTGLKEEIDGYRLHASAGQLWSIGQKHIACFDGKGWKLFACPDNL